MDNSELNKRIGECSNHIVEEIMLSVEEMLEEDAEESDKYAMFMMTIQRVSVKGAVIFSKGQKQHALGAADLLHQQIREAINRVDWLEEK